jgi:tetratricopeptide (TPR) repeat protein
MKKKLPSILIYLLIILLFTGCGKASKYDREGKESFEKGKYEEAADNFSKAVAANPNRSEYYIDYGLALIALGRYEDAITQFDSAYIDKDMLTIQENNKRALRGKGIAFFHMAEYQKAIEEFQKALKISELSKLNVDILYYMGASYRTIGSYDEAMKAYSSVLSEDEKNAGAFAERAFCYQSMGDYKKSLADYDKAISLKPGYMECYFDKYFLMLDEGDPTGAAKVLEKASDLPADTEEDKYSLAKIHFLQKDYKAAEAELKESFDAGFTEAYYYIGEIYRIQKDYTKAAYYYENYIKSGEITYAGVYNQIAVCLIKEGDYKKALEYLETGIALNQARTLQTLKKNEIIACENLGMFDKAKEKLEEYLENYPQDSEALREAEFVINIMKPAAGPEGSN